MNILISTLGASWAVVPEIYGWLAPDILDLYKARPDTHLIDERHNRGLKAPEELWLCTSDGERALNSVDKVIHWWQQLKPMIPLRIWQCQDSGELDTNKQLALMRELIVRLVLMANEKTATDQLCLSLAGGRKTMSADLQWAGSILGADAMLHVIATEPLDARLRSAATELFLSTLPASLAVQIMPVYLGESRRSDALDVTIDDGPPITSERFPLPYPETLQPCLVRIDQVSLTIQIETREADGRRLLGNYVQSLGRDEAYGNWRTLYRLPPARIEQLRCTRLMPEHLDWLIALPKAELHRHIGGSLSYDAQQRVAAAILSDSDACSRNEARALLHEFINTNHVWPDDWPNTLRDFPPRKRALCAALLLSDADQKCVQQALYESSSPRIALVTRHRLGFGAYERPGELSGSAVLGHPAAISAYAQEIVKQAQCEGLTYLELRGSPGKYDSQDPVGWLKRLRDALQIAGAWCNCKCSPAESPMPLIVGFLWILDRRAVAEKFAAEISCGASATDELSGFLLGFDLAGDERQTEPSALIPYFEPSFRACLSTTIHAGEGQPAEHIWQAAYHLHADRIGHGLTLADTPELMKRFRDRRICLELCPTSNREVVGFHDPRFAEETSELPEYPLRKFINAGVPLTLCTDNPGFSSPGVISLADEYLTASRMSGTGITLWEALALMRNGFKHAFASAEVRHQMMAHADKQVFDILLAKQDLQ